MIRIYIHKSFILNFIILVVLSMFIFTEKITLITTAAEIIILFYSKITEWRQRVLPKIKI